MSKKISIITPCYNEETNVRECYETVKEVMKQSLQGYEYEHIFIDNGSSDKTVEILKEIANQDKRVKIIVHTRNFGISASLFNGMTSANGDAVIPIMADLQDPPEAIIEFVSLWEKGYKVVYGIRREREEGFILRWMRGAFYRWISRISQYDIPVGACEFGLFDRVVVDIMKKYDDYNPYIRGFIPYLGFRYATVDVTWRARKKGKSKSDIWHMIDVGLNGLVSVNRVPLRLFLIAGFILSGLSLLYAFINLVWGLVRYQEITSPGIMTIIVALFFFSGVQLFMIGILGEFIGAIHCQVRKKPLIVEAERVNFE